MKFISEITVSPIEGMQMGNDAMIAAAAWVSTSTAEALERARVKPGDVEGVINYLVKHRHGSPFEHGGLSNYVHAPIFVWREWHRHRIGWSYNEESARYKTLEPVFFVPHQNRPMFKPAEEWKPGRPKFLTIDQKAEEEFDSIIESGKKLRDGLLPDLKLQWLERYHQLCQNLRNAYSYGYGEYIKNLELQVDPGLARDCLPVGIYSSCWVTANPRSIMAFLGLRVGTDESLFRSYPLWEIQEGAKQLEAEFAKHWPITHAAFVKNRRVAP